MQMKNRAAFFLLVLFVVAGAGVLLGGCANEPLPKPLSDLNEMLGMPFQPKAQRLVIGYYENPWPGTPDKAGSFPSMKAFAKSMSAVGPFWYKVNADGTVESKESKLVYDTARNLKLKMYPLVTNKSEATKKILGDPAVRTKAIDNLIRLAQEKQYDGLNIDFELLPPEQRQNLTAFMAELYPRMKAIHKTVIVSVFPQVEVHEDVSGAYDYPQLAKNADYLQIMTYDNHWATSKPGPVAPVDWYEKNIQYAIEKAGGPQKIIVGVSAYGYDWQVGGKGETITYPDAIVLADKKGAKILYDEAAQAPYFKYDGHEVWFENDKSVAAKLDIVAKYKPAGIAIWRLGQEQPEIWAEIDKRFPKSP